jgi:hypothetical protein
MRNRTGRTTSALYRVFDQRLGIEDTEKWHDQAAAGLLRIA